MEYIVKCNPQSREMLLVVSKDSSRYDQILMNVPQLEALNRTYLAGDYPNARVHGALVARMSKLESFTASGSAKASQQIMHEICKFEIRT